MSDQNETNLSKRRFLQAAGVTVASAAAGLPFTAAAQEYPTVRVQSVPYRRWQLNATFLPKYRPQFEAAVDRLLKLDPRIVFDALVMTESQNNQFDKYGNTLQSPSNAFGSAQVLLKTAKGVAEKHKIVFDVNKFMKDEAYNKDIGFRYFLEVRDFFGGNNFLALMAYNGGPTGTVNRINTYGERIEATGVSMIDMISSVVNQENRHYPIKTMLNLNLIDLKSLGPDYTGNSTGINFETRRPGRGYNNGYSAQLFKYRRRYNLPDSDDDVISPTAAFKMGMQLLPVMGAPGTLELHINGVSELSPNGELSIPSKPISEGAIAPTNQKNGLQELNIQ